ncbi:MAG: sugar phosphate isomerase/epimerase [Candidatus Lokiarchaeota archaeon]|nr:sugar phosphate isomerase/epimerase [Candidatus Lokiarchaeota archaeon]
MKLSIVSGLNEIRNTQDEISKNFSKLCEFLKSINYDGIELSLLEPEKIDVKRINEIKDSYDFEISAIGTGSTYIRFGYSLGHQNEDIRKNAIKRIKEYVNFAHEIQSKVIIGLIRGRFNFESNSKKEKSNIKSSLKECCRIAENSGVILLFEPINRFEIDSYNTISESIELINEMGSGNLKLLLDSYHIHLEEDPGFIWDYLEEITDYVSHIHLADCTRRAPGTGHFDFRTFLNIFNSAGYKDFASIETIMKPSFEEVASESSEYLRLILKS